jgi:hypothetical protein
MFHTVLFKVEPGRAYCEVSRALYLSAMNVILLPQSTLSTKLRSASHNWTIRRFFMNCPLPFSSMIRDFFYGWKWKGGGSEGYVCDSDDDLSSYVITLACSVKNDLVVPHVATGSRGSSIFLLWGEECFKVLQYKNETQSLSLTSSWVKSHQHDNKEWQTIDDLKSLKLSSDASLNVWCDHQANIAQQHAQSWPDWIPSQQRNGQCFLVTQEQERSPVN